MSSPPPSRADERSIQQVEFHDAFIVACGRVLYKRDWELHKPAIAIKNGWLNVKSEVMIRCVVDVWRRAAPCVPHVPTRFSHYVLVSYAAPLAVLERPFRAECIRTSSEVVRLRRVAYRCFSYRVAMFCACIALSCTLDIVIFSPVMRGVALSLRPVARSSS